MDKIIFLPELAIIKIENFTIYLTDELIRNRVALMETVNKILSEAIGEALKLEIYES